VEWSDGSNTVASVNKVVVVVVVVVVVSAVIKREIDCRQLAAAQITLSRALDNDVIRITTVTAQHIFVGHPTVLAGR
jgi:hypothetical protein